MTKDEKLTQRTIKNIKKGGRILLRKGKGNPNEGDSHWYLDVWTNIAAGPDHAIWSCSKRGALDFFNLQWALTIAPLYGAKVVVVYPKSKT